MARRPGVPLRRRIAARLPGASRVIACFGATAGIAALAWLVNGPWLRVEDVRWDGGRFTPSAEIADALEPVRGAPLLAVDTTAARTRLEALPSVVEAHLTTSLTGSVRASIVEPEPAVIWETRRALLVGDAEGRLFAALSLDADLPDGLAGVPRIADERFDGRVLAVGDRIPASLLGTALALASVDPIALGSAGERFGVRIDDDFGLLLVSEEPAWEAAFGIFGLDPRATPAEVQARLERQVTAVRTLFATRSEAEIGWVDVRNPGKVYFRAKG